MLKKSLLAALLAVLFATPFALAQQPPNPMTVEPNVQGLTPSHTMSAATTNSTLIAAGRHALYGINVINTSAAIVYVKLYNKVTAPTCGTDTPVAQFQIAATTGQLQKGFFMPVSFPLGIGLCMTALPANADTTAVATGVSVDLAYK